METRTWYSSETGCANQALIIDEATGRSVAVAYDAEDAPLLASAPTMLSVIDAALTEYTLHGSLTDTVRFLRAIVTEFRPK